MRRAGVVAHFDPQHRVDPHVLHLISELRTVCERIVFVSASQLPPAELQAVSRLVDHASLRPNLGGDFASYRQGLLELEPLGFDEVVLLNDSVYGPLMPLAELFARMEPVTADAWSATSSWDISFHLQSYFLVFRRRTLEHPLFRAFWRHLALQTDRRSLVRRCEVGLSYVLQRAGLRLASFMPPPSILEGLLSRTDPREHPVARIPGVPGARRAWLIYVLLQELLHACWDFGIYREVARVRQIDPTHARWRRNARRGSLAFLKVNLLRDFPERGDIRDVAPFLRRHTRYDPGLIAAHRARLSGEPPRQPIPPRRAGRGRRLDPPERRRR